MKRTGLILLLVVIMLKYSYGQTLLNADGVSDTYDLINSVLAPGYSVIEAPGNVVGSCDNHSAFGDHITQVFDDSLETYVFAFHIHVDEDNDRCINFDRQRNEIKTYDKSPDNLLGVLGETVEYKWRFRLDVGFQPSSSFTHIHQLKSVGSSEDSMPLMCLTARKGSPDKLELRYAAYTNQSTIHKVDLDPFKGVWVEATERLTYGEAGYGNYTIALNRVHDGQNLMTYSTETLRMWKTNADFIRPKWGIYRSLNDAGSLRDEIVCFASFSIYEDEDHIAPELKIEVWEGETVPIQDDFRVQFTFSEGVEGFEEADISVKNGEVLPGSFVKSSDYRYFVTIDPEMESGDSIRVSIDAGVANDFAGNTSLASEELVVPVQLSSSSRMKNSSFLLYPNPVKDVITIQSGSYYQDFELSMIDQRGKVLFHNSYSGNEIAINVSEYISGIYLIKILTTNAVFYQTLIIR